MASLKEVKSKTLGSLAAVQTILEKYPVLVTVDSLKSVNVSMNSMDFLVDILKTLGAYEGLIDWLARYLTVALPALETVVKTILKTNFKNTIACSIDPFIPDVDENDPLSSDYFASGVTIDLAELDMTGMLRTYPLDEKIGQYFYFGTEGMKLPKELKGAQDFNAFLWYIINKANEYVPLKDAPADKGYGKVTDDPNGDNTWTNIWSNGKKDKDSNTGTVPADKIHGIAVLNFEEQSFPFNNKLRFRIHEWYKGKYTITINGVTMRKNATIFEFNNDYINSIKLFDAKVVAAQLIDNLCGALSFSANYSIEQNYIRGQVDQIIKRIVEAPDSKVDNCWFSFSNEEYDELLKKATLQHAGLYAYSGDTNNATSIDADSLLSSLSGMSSAATLEEQTSIIKNTFLDVSGKLGSDAVVEAKDSFSFRLNIVEQLVKNLCGVIIQSILSPKVYLLFIINSKFMGKLSGPESIKDIPTYFQEFLESSMTLLAQIIEEVKDEILQSVLDYVLELLKPLAAQLTTRIAKETIRDFQELMAQLLQSCLLSGWGGSSSYGGENAIDKVNYADIIPQETTPQSSSTC